MRRDSAGSPDPPAQRAAAAAARRQQQVEELCGAAVRALTGDRDLHFRGGRLHSGHTPYPATAPHLRPTIGADDFASFRGAADGLALRRVHSDPLLHRELSPVEPVPRMIFELLEQFRVEALGASGLPGVATNLRHRHQAWLAAFQAAGATETTTGMLLFTLVQVSRSRVTGEPVVVVAEDDLMEASRATLVPPIAADLAALRRCRRDQREYAGRAASVARAVAGLLETMADAEEGLGRASARDTFSLFLDVGDDGASDDPVAAGSRTAPATTAGGYRVFTRTYDRERRPGELVRPAVLAEYRRRLDALVAEQGVNLPRLARTLQALLAQPAEQGWEDAQEEGLIDGRRLTQLIATPSERRLFRRTRREPLSDCLVTLLLDCSGSMRQHKERVAVVVDLLARALDLVGVDSEVLGFTTGSWHGGRALRDWKRAGRPAHPGRLNEVLHLVFKDADTSWRRARPGLAGLLRDDLFREGVDGEAVAWACARMRERPERRRVLLVVCDGSPMDSATALANDQQYLDRHLREVVLREELTGRVELLGLGVGLDLSSFFTRSRAVDLDTLRPEPVDAPADQPAAGSGNRLLADIAFLLAGRGSR